MTWQPQQQALRELVYLLNETSKVDNDDLAMINQRLYVFNEHPDFNAYLAYILIKLKDRLQHVRLIAGRHLHNNIQSSFNDIPLIVLSYIKRCCIDFFNSREDDAEISQAVSSIVVTIIRHGQPHNWPEIFHTLIENLSSSNNVTLETALKAVTTICEHAAPELDFETKENVRPLTSFIKRFAEFYAHPNPTIRMQAINATSQFILLKPQSLIVQLDAILQSLFSIAADEKNPHVRQVLGRMLATILEAFPEKIEPYIDQIITYMIEATSDTNEQIQLTACDFWVQYAQSSNFKDRLISHLPRLVESLLKLMVYSEADLSLNTIHTISKKITPQMNGISPQIINENARILETSSDQDQSIQPTRSYCRYKMINDQEQLQDGTTDRNVSLSDFEEEESDTSSEDAADKEDSIKIWGNEQDVDDEAERLEDNFEDEEFYSEDTLRKYSAAALDVLSISFKDDIAKVILDLLQRQLLVNESWVVRESGILALGAAAEGGIDVISQHLYYLIPYLLNSLNDPNPLIRSISCWTLSRFSNWLIDQYDFAECSATTFFEPVLFGLLKKLTDSNQRVQESACTAFIIVGEAASFRLTPYIRSILIQTNVAFYLYGRKNRHILYDALGTLADAVQSELNLPEFIGLLMPPLISKWNELPDHDTDLFPLLECMSIITAALGSGFIQYVEPVLSRCVKLISSTLQKQLLAEQFPDEVSPPNVDFLIAALDLLSGIVQGLGPKIDPFIAETNPPLLSLLRACIHDPVPEVLQSTFVLIGDIATASLSLLLPFIQDIVTEMIHILSNTDCIMPVSVYNNVLWAFGEIIMRWGTNIRPYIPSLVEAFTRFLTDPQAPASIQENAMVALGRLGYACPESVAPYLFYFLKPWLEKSLSVRDGDEKDSAFVGLCLMIKFSVQNTCDELPLLLHAVSMLKSPSITLSTELTDMVMSLHKSAPSKEWDDAVSQLQPEARNVICRLRSNAPDRKQL